MNAVTKVTVNARNRCPLALQASVWIACVLVTTADAASPPASFDFRTVLAWQIALDAHGYSPGVIDGVFGRKTRLAIAAVEATLGGQVTGQPRDELARRIGVDPSSAVVSYRITASDAKSVGPVPADWVGKSRLRWLPYDSLLDALAERFHTTEKCLGRLNRGADLRTLRVGDVLDVPNARPTARRVRPAVDRVEIDIERRLLLLLRVDPRGERYLHGLVHCSVARDTARAPIGDHNVLQKVKNPPYTFDPASWPEVKDVDRRLDIPPGPRSPVGTCWIKLNGDGIGIHGSPAPENIGKTGSHGCFRLTNWDVEWLASIVGRGTPVTVVRSAAETSWSWKPRG